MTLARAWKAKAKDYRMAARFAESVYRRRESRLREQRARLALAEQIVAAAARWGAHDERLAALIREWRDKG
jgi:hypothetical protein